MAVTSERADRGRGLRFGTRRTSGTSRPRQKMRLVRRYGRAPGPQGGRPLLLSEASRQAIRSHDWPGNVRELINMCQRVAMLGEGPEVEPEDLGLAARSSAT